ncbi:MAG TPA: hypothetical protein VG757_00170 [Devosia sp.]|nr:hypothetical protein [Devosia sp.]
MDDPRPSGQTRNWLPWLIAALAAAGVVLVVIGRLMDAGRFAGWQDAVYSVLLAFSIDGTFLNPQNPLTPLGALFAALALYLALLAGALALLGKRITAFRASRQRDHVVVIGSGAEAGGLAEQLSKDVRVVLVTAEERALHGVLAIPRPAGAAEHLTAANAGAARAVVVTGPDEKDNAALALGLAGMRRGATPAIWAEIGDRIIADRLANAVGGAGRIRVFSEAPMLARELFARHPAHAVAERMAAGRVHLLIAGFGRFGQAIAEEGIYSGIAAGLGRPMVSVLVRDAGQAEARYRASRPALDLAADFAFIEADLVALAVAPGLAQGALAALAMRDDVARVTQIALCLGDDADNVRLALVLPELRRREGRYFAPAFMRARDPEALHLVTSKDEAGIADPNSGVAAIAGAAGLIAAEVLDRARRDSAARALHEAYLRQQGVSAGAGTDWNDLPETYRRANRRGADHLAAKLWSLGLTSEADPTAPVAVEGAAHERLIAPLLAHAKLPATEMLADLERRRWVAERAMDGWVAGRPRDDDRKIHPLLEGGAEAVLAEADRAKDRAQIQVVLGSVVVAPAGSGAMPETRIAIAGHRNLGAETEAAAAKAAAAALAARFGAGDAVTLVSPLAPGADIAATEAVAEALEGRAGELRLIAVEAVPYRVVLERAARENGGGEALVAAMMARRAKLFGQFVRVDIVRIGMAGISDDTYRRNGTAFEAGLRRANAFLARRCDLGVLLWDGAEARGPGGTGELAAWMRDPAGIPADCDFAQRGPLRDDRLLVIPVRR